MVEANQNKKEQADLIGKLALFQAVFCEWAKQKALSIRSLSVIFTTKDNMFMNVCSVMIV